MESFMANCDVMVMIEHKLVMISDDWILIYQEIEELHDNIWDQQGVKVA